jgi:hypothetical protein
MKALAGYVMRGPWQATGATALFGGLGWLLPPVAVFSSAAVGLVTLRLGARDGLTVVAGATLLLGLLAYGGFGAFEPAIGQCLLIWLPVVAVAMALRYTQSQGTMLLTAGVIAGFFALGLRILVRDADAWWRDVATKVLKEAPAMADSLAPQLTVDAIAPYLNGMAAASVLLNLALSVLLARWWQSVLFNPGGFRQEFYELRLPVRLAWLFLVNALVILAMQRAGSSGGYGMDVFVLLMSMYVFQGLALAHYYRGRRNASLLWLTAIYGGLLVVAPQMLILLGAVGLTDSVIDFRRFPRAGDNA